MNPRLSVAQRGRAVAAVDLVAASSESNLTNMQAVLGENTVEDILQGLILLAGSLRASLAVAWSLNPDELDEQVRAMFEKADTA